MRIGVIQYPGTLDDDDAIRAITYAGGVGVKIWHKERKLAGCDAVVIPGGFSYGDYLRCGAIASFAPIMEDVVTKARQGFPVLGICNGFQILCESELLPGALTRNKELYFISRDQQIQIEGQPTVWTKDFTSSEVLTIPLKNGEGAFQASTETVKELESEGRVIARYLGPNPNGSLNAVAGIANDRGNIVGLMPHPEHAISSLTGPGIDGLRFFTSVITSLVAS
jgi:phosphoribosylformylglycinamidine synthase